ncbi:hypothetical protein B9G55_14780 [Saccharibacillus sp. O16]|nr:hypothetical protein B9G55_14780 [Saccharibacillus sp. O16]
MTFSLSDLLHGRYLRTQEDLAAEYRGARYIGWTRETGTLWLNEPRISGDSVVCTDPLHLEERLIEESRAYLRGFQASAYNRGVYAFGYHVDSGSGKIYPILNVEERADEEDANLYASRTGQASMEEKLLSPRWYGSNVYGIYPVRFSEEFDELLETRMTLQSANRERYENQYGGFVHPRSYLFDVRIFDELLKPLAFRALRRLQEEGTLERLNRTDDFMLYFFDHDDGAQALETVMRELNGDEKFERLFAAGK